MIAGVPRPKFWIKGSRGDGTYTFETLIDRDMILGRDRSSAVPLATKYASRRHIAFTQEDDEWFIQDLESQNGTHVNERKLGLHEKHRLKEGDKIMIGLKTDHRISFHFTIIKTTQEDFERICKKWKGQKSRSGSQSSSDRSESTLGDLHTHQQSTEDTDLKLNGRKPFVKMVPLPSKQVMKLLSKREDLMSEEEEEGEIRDEPEENKERGKSSRKSSESSSDSVIAIDLPVSVTNSRSMDRSGLLKNKRNCSDSDANQNVKKHKTINQPPISTGVATRRSPRKDNAVAPSTFPLSKSVTRGVRLIDSKPLTRNAGEKLTAASRPSPSTTTTDPRLNRRVLNDSSKTKSVLDEIIPEPGRVRVAHVPQKPTGQPVTGGSSNVPVVTGRDLLMKQTTSSASSSVSSDPRSWANTVLYPSSSNSSCRNTHRPKPKHNIDQFLEHILRWNPLWLQERKNNSAEPPVVDPAELYQLQPTYDTHEHYVSTQYPYILYEIFANFAETFDFLKQEDTLRGHVVKYESTAMFTKVTLECPILDRFRSKVPAEGDAVLIEMKITDCSRNQEIDFMGYAYISESFTDGRNNLNDKSYNVPAGCKKITRYLLLIKKHQQVRIHQEVQVKMMRLDYVRPLLKHIEGLIALKSSKLLTDILRPRIVTCQIPFPRQGDIRSPIYNEAQHQAILGSTEAVKRGSGVPKIVLIQGPPGTGKTHTLIGILQHIFKTWNLETGMWDPHKLPKILVCAPSNGAVDEIGARLFSERNFLTQCIPHDKHPRSLRLVRVGQDEQIRPDCKHMLLEEHVKRNLKQGAGLENKVKEIEKHIAELDIEISNLRYANKFGEAAVVECQMEKLSRDVDRIRKEQQMDGDTEFKRRAMREEVLKKADIILTTLNSCRTPLLENVFNTDSNCGFNCVVVDEASQCSEPEILMPLYYFSITKMILIGDPMQLPATVKSVIAQKAGYGQSLFERIFHFFGSYSKGNPVHLLNQQFRMHREICNFPSQQFYGGRLQTAEGVGILPNFPLKPYTVIDVTDTIQDTSDPKNIINKNEAIFISSLLKLMEKNFRKNAGPITVGIITPYNGQKKLLIDKLRSTSFSQIKVDVNTIDGFQGQEREVIIFSSVRASEGNGPGSIGFMSSERRMNVALTRAKHAVIVCISRSSLESNKLWGSLIRDAESRRCLEKVSAFCTMDTMARMLLLPAMNNSVRRQ